MNGYTYETLLDAAAQYCAARTLAQEGVALPRIVEMAALRCFMKNDSDDSAAILRQALHDLAVGGFVFRSDGALEPPQGK